MARILIVCGPTDRSRGGKLTDRDDVARLAEAFARLCAEQGAGS